MKYLDNTITSDYLDFSLKRNTMIISRNVIYTNSDNILKSDVVEIWGTGKPLREFLHVDDLAEAALHVMNLEQKQYTENTEPMCSHINIGSGEEISIASLAKKIAKITNFQGSIEFDLSKPDGSPRKLMSSSRLSNLGWKPKINIDDGLSNAYQEYKNSLKVGMHNHIIPKNI